MSLAPAGRIARAARPAARILLVDRAGQVLLFRFTPGDDRGRVVEHLDERIITAAGVSSGIDMALRLSELLVDETAAKAMQLMIEYDPQPPFDAGSVDKAGDEVMTRLIEYTVDKS